MKQFRISVHSFADIQDFVTLAISQPFEVFVGNNSQTINAKSLMAMFTLNYRYPLVVSADCDEAAFDRFQEAAARFINA